MIQKSLFPEIDQIKKTISMVVNNVDQADIVLQKILAYVVQIQAWGHVHNITSRKSSEREILSNILDSIIFLEAESKCSKEIFEKDRIVDAGAGNGFPGILLAMIFPQKEFVLVDFNRKKCSFLRSVKSELALENVEIKNVDIRATRDAKLLVSKAAFSPPNVNWLCDALACEGCLLLWANQNTEQEFKFELQKKGMKLLEDLKYSISGHGLRQMLLFKKQRQN